MVETSVGHKLPLLLAVSVHRINGSFQCGQLFDGIALGFPQKLHGFLTDIADFHWAGAFFGWGLAISGGSCRAWSGHPAGQHGRHPNVLFEHKKKPSKFTKASAFSLAWNCHELGHPNFPTDWPIGPFWQACCGWMQKWSDCVDGRRQGHTLYQPQKPGVSPANALHAHVCKCMQMWYMSDHHDILTSATEN